MRISLVLLLVLAALFSACEIQNPNLPEWDVELNLPLINEIYYMRDLVDSVNIVADAEDNIYLVNEGTVSTAQFGDASFTPDIPSEQIPLLSGMEYTGAFDIQDIENGYQIAYGELAEGFLRHRFSGINSATTSITITFGELFNADGSPFTISYAGSEAWVSNDLRGCKIGTFNSNLILAQLSYSILATSSLPNGTSLGNLTFGLTGSLRFSTFQGILTNYRLDMEPNNSVIDISYPLGLESAIQLAEASLTLVLENRIGFYCEFHGEFFAKNTTTGNIRTLPILDDMGNHYVANPSHNGLSSFTDISFTNNVNFLLAIMPDHIEVRNAYFIIRSHDDRFIGTVKATDFIDGDYTINAPFTFSLFAERVVVKQSTEVEISTANQDRIRNNALRADLHVEFTNKFPFGATGMLYVGTSPDFDIDVPETYSFSKTAAFVSSEVNPDAQIIQLSLSKTELDLFANDKVYIRWAFVFANSLTPITITASPADYVQARAMIKAKIRVTEDL